MCDALCVEVGQCLEQLTGQSGEGLRARGQKTLLYNSKARGDTLGGAWHTLKISLT